MNFYPISLNLKNKKVLVVGGGHVALRKIDTLLESGAMVTVVAPNIEKGIKRKKRIKRICRNFKSSDVDGFYMVIGATSDKSLNKKVSQAGREKNKLVNIVDNQALCDFIAPAVIRRGDFVISVSTSGDAPFFTKHLAARLRKIYGKEYTLYIKLLSQARKKVISRIKEHKKRQKLFNKMLAPSIVNMIKSGKPALAKKKLNEIINKGVQ